MIPTIPGVPSWGALLIAVTFTAIGFAFDAGAGGKELTLVFAVAYAVGCVAAVVAVRQSGVFTAVIQPPLILFVSVPGAYFLFHGATMDGVKDLLINCGYPLIERFPLMFFTTAMVLLVGLVRWYVGMSRRRSAPVETAATEGPLSAVTSKIAGLLTRDADTEDAADEVPASRRDRQHSIDRSARTAKSAAAATRTRSGRPVKRTQPSRSRHNRPPETEIIEPVAERPRRPRTARRSTEPTVPPVEPRRRSRSSSTREPRKQPPPTERRSSYQRPDRHSRFDGFEPFEPHGTNGANGSNGSSGTNGSRNGSHHPISRVRYRGADDGEQRSQYRARPRTSRPKHRADAWEYDV
ncbi:DUF6542 domain-containing protein [Mycolicibacterium stellerae]|uniref:DUF6542 domain-containing protein n=1 Tax=Mycolicibacterium stellerae TaxID=2358193 RepID=UPI002E1436E4